MVGLKWWLRLHKLVVGLFMGINMRRQFLFLFFKLFWGKEVVSHG